jgi:hypothetical protein
MLAENVARTGDRMRATSDAAWAEARRLYGGTALAALVPQITKINAAHGFESAVRRTSPRAQT